MTIFAKYRELLSPKKWKWSEKTQWSFELQVPSSIISACVILIIALHVMDMSRYRHGHYF